MENEYEISSSSLSFASFPGCPGSVLDTDVEANPDYLSLSKLSSSLEKLLHVPSLSYADAEIVVDGIPVGVHRGILAARSEYFHGLFSKPCDDYDTSDRAVKEDNQGNGSNKKPTYHMSDLVGGSWGYVGLEAFNLVLNYLYTGRLKPPPPEVSTCVDDQCLHHACRPAIDYVVQLMYASTAFQIKELVLLLQVPFWFFLEITRSGSGACRAY